MYETRDFRTVFSLERTLGCSEHAHGQNMLSISRDMGDAGGGGASMGMQMMHFHLESQGESLEFIHKQYLSPLCACLSSSGVFDL
jgi:hypothetical protein